MMTLIFMILIILLIPLILMSLNFMFSTYNNNDREKLTPFECGFDPFSSPRLPFSIQFYLISIIFLIFDIEIIIFLPMISSFLNNKIIHWLETSMIFISILLLGLYMEWNNGALTWLK